MTIPAVGATAPATPASTDPKAALDKAYQGAVQKFMDYMKETPAQRMQERWLAAHGITKEQFDAMSPAQKEAVIKQMQQDIKEKLREQAEQNKGTPKIMDLLS